MGQHPLKTIASIFVWSGTRPRRRTFSPSAKHRKHCEQVTFPSLAHCGETVELSGWLFPAQKPLGSIILCHGHTSDKREMADRAFLFSKHHFTTLTFDFRARGMSGGDACTLGWLEQLDVLGAIKYLQARNELQHLPIGAIGSSMGAAACILAAAQPLGGGLGIRAIVAEASFGNLDAAVRQRAGLFLGRAGKTVAEECAKIAKCQLDMEIGTISPADAIPLVAPRPVLLIEDGLDLTCPSSQSKLLQSQAKPPFEIWVARAAPHSGAFFMYPELYVQRVCAFMKAAFTAGSTS